MTTLCVYEQFILAEDKMKKQSLVMPRVLDIRQVIKVLYIIARHICLKQTLPCVEFAHRICIMGARTRVYK